MPRKPASSKIRHIGRPSPNRLVLRATLRHTHPPIWREISVSDEFSLFHLHRVLQLVFGWLDYHLFQFEIGGRRFERQHEEATGDDASSAFLALVLASAWNALGPDTYHPSNRGG